MMTRLIAQLTDIHLKRVRRRAPQNAQSMTRECVVKA